MDGLITSVFSSIGWLIYKKGWPGENPNPVPARIRGQVWLDPSVPPGADCSERPGKGVSTTYKVRIEIVRTNNSTWSTDCPVGPDGSYDTMSLGPLLWAGTAHLSVTPSPGAFWCDQDDPLASGSTTAPVTPNAVRVLIAAGTDLQHINFGFK